MADHGKGQLVDQILARARGDDVLVVLVVLQRQRHVTEMGDLGLPVLQNTTTQLRIGVRNVALEHGAHSQPVLTAERVLADSGVRLTESRE